MRARGVRPGPHEEAEDEEGRRQREPHGGVVRATLEHAGRAQPEEERPVEGEERECGQPPEQRIRVEKVEQVAGEVALCVDRHAVDHVRERDAPEERGHGARDGEDRVPAAAPLLLRAFVAVLDRDAADDEADEHEEEGEIEAREERRVPAGERRERRAAGDEQPHLVAVPDRADRADERPALADVTADEGQEHADAEVEPLQDEVARPEHDDEEEPERLQVPVAVRRCGEREHQ